MAANCYTLHDQDVGKALDVTFLQADGTTPHDLTGGTVDLIVRTQGTFTASIVSGTLGTARRVYAASDFAAPASGIDSIVYDGLWRATLASGNTIHFPEDGYFKIFVFASS